MAEANLVGTCLCGAIRFELTPPLRPIIVCHCRQCALWTGYAVAATAVDLSRFHLQSGAGDLRWFSSSEHADRGFCATCGSSLFWRPRNGSRIAVLAGLLQSPTGLSIAAHVYVADKADFYDISGDAPRFPAAGGDTVLISKQ